MDVKALVEQQFSRAAARYATRPVHGGPDVARMLEAARLEGGERVLDLGCGPGHTALAFAERAGEVVGLDLSASMLELARDAARRRGLSNLRFERGDAERLPFDDAEFDVVTTRYSAHRYPQPLSALGEAARVLRPGGVFLLLDSISPEDSTQDTFLNAIELVRDPSHVRNHRISEWRCMLEATGFSAELLDSWPLPLDFEAWVERIGAPPASAAQLRALFDGAPREVREALAIGQPGAYDWAIPVALLRGLRGSPCRR